MNILQLESWRCVKRIARGGLPMTSLTLLPHGPHFSSTAITNRLREERGYGNGHKTTKRSIFFSSSPLPCECFSETVGKMDAPQMLHWHSAQVANAAGNKTPRSEMFPSDPATPQVHSWTGFAIDGAASLSLSLAFAVSNSKTASILETIAPEAARRSLAVL